MFRLINQKVEIKFKRFIIACCLRSLRVFVNVCERTLFTKSLMVNDV